MDEFDLVEALDVQVTVRHRAEGHLFRFGVFGGEQGSKGELRFRNYRNGQGPQSASTFVSQAHAFATREAMRSGLI